MGMRHLREAVSRCTSPKQKSYPEKMEYKYTVSGTSLLQVIFLIFLLTACTNSNSWNYEYPRRFDLERQRVCRQVLQRNTNKFFVSETRIHTLMGRGKMYPFAETETKLEDGVYYCGAYRFRHQICPPLQTRYLDEKSCRFKR